ncbi:Ebp2-domain-containing protein [Sodiomyces alkalinus F11]|uniref:Ebp2-domain-containing protein n=1 Tax=Sodiomyces alkalinus (strain CBS 110278 / VKM F-3762 / F11) TaxID=1314773 RepID=A0A3N2Q2H9_SODAK|nr:Ebp2-domain-containing protein [Sodiomyces alkalinus F11]ROT40878.1 Ebp2-domain-containing protein [Sodiomyces alkalinus F11]
MGRSALKLALAAEKGKDPREKKLKRQLKQKRREKENKKNQGVQPVDDDEVEDEDDASKVDEEEGGAALARSDDEGSEDDSEGESEEDSRRVDIEALNDTDSDSESDIEMEEKIVRPKNDPPKGLAPSSRKRKAREAEEAEDDEDDEDEEDDDEEDEAIPLSDLEGDEREDIVPHTKLTINNKAALNASLARIAINTSASVPFATHQSLVSEKPTAEAVPDVGDDLKRELAFLSQSLDAARRGRSLLIREKVPFTRPGDYFAEMVKDDGQMEKVRAKLVEEATAKKAAAEARKLRDLKKFGKQVQVAKLQERQKAKRDTLEKIDLLKKKRQENGTSNLDTHEGDIFDVAVDKELKGYNPKSGSGRGRMEPNRKRQKKDEKYGFGGKKRNSKSNDAVSSGDLSGFNPKKMKSVAWGGVSKTKPTANRPGKNRRKAMASK